MGSPFLTDKEISHPDGEESEELYQLAVKNKVSLIYLQSLKRDGELAGLQSKYREEATQYSAFLDSTARASLVMNEVGAEYTLFEMLKPYPAISGGLNIVILGNGNEYKKAIAAFLKAGYPPENSAVDVASLSDKNKFDEAVQKLSQPMPSQNHRSPYAISFLDVESATIVNLHRAIAVNNIPFMDKSRLHGNIVESELANGVSTRILNPEFDLASMIALSSVDYRYLLGEFYTFLSHLEEMDEQSLLKWLNVTRENRLFRATRVFVTITSRLHKAAFGTIPEKLSFIEGKLGMEPAESDNLERSGYTMPYRYRLLTVGRVFWEKMGEPDFRRGVFKEGIGSLLTRFRKSL